MATRVLVVDDSVVFRRAVSQALSGIEGIEVVGVASNGRLALNQIAALQPDLVTLDVEMPEVDGIEVLRKARAAGERAGFLMLSVRTRRGSELTMRALELGAFDFLPKPEGGGTGESGIEELRTMLAPLIRAWELQREGRSEVRSQPRAPAAVLPGAALPTLKRPATQPGSRFVLIGVSTGGPVALARLLPAIPPDLGAPIFIVQHMPAMFTAALAASLSAKCAIRVKEAADGEVAEPNCAYLAPGGRHMKLAPGDSGQIVLNLSDDPPENHCRPAVDYLFRSAALHFPGRAVAAILTGMGCDGTAGLKMLKRTGCLAVAQDEASCVVFGMPKEAIQAGVVDCVASLEQIAVTLTRWVREAGRCIRLEPGDRGVVTQYIHSLCGVSLDDSKDYLIEGRLGGLADEAGCSSFMQLIRFARDDASGALPRRIVDAITTGETLILPRHGAVRPVTPQADTRVGRPARAEGPGRHPDLERGLLQRTGDLQHRDPAQGAAGRSLPLRRAIAGNGHLRRSGGSAPAAECTAR